MNRRDFAAFACACMACGAPGAFARQLSPKLTPGFRPPAESDENGLWDMMGREEGRLRGSRFVVRDPVLNKYVHDIACRLAGDFCPDIRLYIVRAPYFNASMAPNGMMQVWTGTLLRAQNEAQLAAVIGHELGHYLRRHTVDRFRDARDKTAISTFLSMGLAVAGLGAVGSLTGLLLVASVMSFGRDQEREADAIGLDLMHRAGYDPGEAAAVWSQLIAERKARENPSGRDLIFASHPGEEEREGTLRESAATLEGAGSEARRHRDRYLAHLKPLRQALIADELRLRHYGPSLALFERVLQLEPDDGDIAFAMGEVYRLRQKDGDLDAALRAYERALASRAAPPETHRSTALVHRQRGDRDAANAAFRRYLQALPDAEDALMINAYMQET